MDRNRYFNELLFRMEQVFYHELSDCASWKTELVGTDFIQSQDIRGRNEQEIIEACIERLKAQGLAEEIDYSIGGKGVLLQLRVKGCPLMLKETLLKNSGIKPYNCCGTNMILDQLIEKLNYTTAYVADIKVDEGCGECLIKAAVYATPEKIGEVSDWSQEPEVPRKARRIPGGPSAYEDTFTRDSLPPVEQRPEFLFDHADFQYPDRLNCAAELLDRAVAGGHGDRPVIHSEINGRKYFVTYRQLLKQANRIAHVLKEDLGLVPGNRVLLPSPNNRMLAACLFGVLKAGGVVVPVMPLLRAKELRQIVNKAQVRFALCDGRLVREMDAAGVRSRFLERTVYFNHGGAGSLELLMERKPVEFANVETAADDVALIAFTSGTTGEPKGAMHFHRDVLAMCDSWPRGVLKPGQDDIFCGTPPLAFTYGLGVMLAVPMRFGASTVLIEDLTPDRLLKAIQDYRCSFVATAPVYFRRMAPLAGKYELSSLRMAVSSGDALSEATRDMFHKATGLVITDGLGCTEMMQTFLSHTPDRLRPGAIGYVTPGYRVEVLDEAGRACAPGVVGRLAVKGPSGCLYLADERQKQYVQGGWNVTGDACSRDQDGYFYFHGRYDDLIVSSGYNIDGFEVESALLEHEAVAECAVVGVPDAERGSLVTAFVVLKRGQAASDQLARELQEHVKSAIAPYKYPRLVEFVKTLPRSGTGKLQRFKLREKAGANADADA
jgi:2-aminobenzoate-CoA ligase